MSANNLSCTPENLDIRSIKAKEDLVVDKTWAERQKKDLLGTILYNYSESYTICGVCDDFIADVYNQSPGFVFLPSDFNYYVGLFYHFFYFSRFPRLAFQIAMTYIIIEVAG